MARAHRLAEERRECLFINIGRIADFGVPHVLTLALKQSSVDPSMMIR